MKTFWFGAAAAAALMSAAAPASSSDFRPLHIFSAAPPAEAGATVDVSQAQRMGAWGFDRTGMNAAVRPGEDFFNHVNGAYVDALEIPSDRSRYGTFDALNELSVNRMRAVLDASAAGGGASGDEALIGTFYKSFMDKAAVDAKGAAPLSGDLAKIRAAATKDDLARLMGETMKGFGGSIFSAYVYDDAKNPERYTVYLGQAGLGMPDRDYYLTEAFAEQKAQYEAYVAELLTLAGWTEPAANAKAIVEMETKIAEVSWTRADRRDDDKTYNPYTPAELKAHAPDFPWDAFIQGADLTEAERVVASENTAFPKIAAIFAETPIEVQKAWAAYTLADQAAPYLSEPFVAAYHGFREKTLSGQPEQRPRWKRGVTMVDTYAGEALGKLYVAEYFPPESKAKMEALVGDIKTAMETRIKGLTWMGDETKAKALEKLSKFTVKIGYPEEWRDYSDLTIASDDLYGNVERAAAFEWAYRVGRLDEPVDDKEWGMTPPTVNAYYSPTKNQIVFPAAILQPPFFDPEADPAINYGGIGGVIGHEITHGFDDQGRKSDGDGKLTDWWTAEDAEKFNAQAQKLGAQYSAIEPLPGLPINGQLSMGENIADLGGVLLALDAYHLSLDGQPAPVIDGFTGDQRVFLGWAQVWRGKYREDALRRQLVSGPHSPPHYRVNVPVANIDTWYEAFDVAPEDAMHVAPEDRVRIW
ncbi:MAG: M13-type metalloendopeptidase [Phenylobacterium sp.]|uniref:M13 family metallopeptidase n=1 Tax=Phenylobacterium sp. TaxID=1871053 RepID=UPI00271B08D1|nr:M13-type metalloendopeptidase [Phenylobacterium sp.]MDO8410278.1 M13-type metalloendopeptidase [Phenylobacterium sp.]